MAASSTGDVLFQRGQDDDNVEDIWDDTALIKAYDEAVSRVKLKVAEQTGVPLTERQSGAGKAKKKKKKHKKTSQRQWSVGDVCRARFTEDNLLYEAEVISVDIDEGTCYVRYTDYGNEEEQALVDLLPVKKKHRKQQQVVPQMPSDIETDSGVEYVTDKASPAPGPRSRAGTSKSPRGKGAVQPGPPPTWPGLTPGPGLMPPPLFPPGSMMGSNLPPPPWAGTQGLPLPIPPPPPPMSHDSNSSSASDEKQDPLCSMLLSWYMSGYHTGYYMGLQQGQKQSGNPYVNR